MTPNAVNAIWFTVPAGISGKTVNHSSELWNTDTQTQEGVANATPENEH